MDFGIRCVILGLVRRHLLQHCFKNGVLPIKGPPEDLEKLFDDADRGATRRHDDLEKPGDPRPHGGSGEVRHPTPPQALPAQWLADIGLTKVKQTAIDSYEVKAKAEHPWCELRAHRLTADIPCDLIRLILVSPNPNRLD